MFLVAQYINHDNYVEFIPIKLYIHKESADKEAYFLAQKDVEKCKKVTQQFKNYNFNYTISNTIDSLLVLPKTTTHYAHNDEICQSAFCVIHIPHTPIETLKKTIENGNSWKQLYKNKHFYSILEILGIVHIGQIILIILLNILLFLIYIQKTI